jgi:hypothetical protein
MAVKIFKCSRCGGLLYFSDQACGSCAAVVGYVPELSIMVVLDDGESFTNQLGRWDLCTRQQWGCNWMVRENSHSGRCLSDRLNRNRPESDDTIGLEQLARASLAKRRLLFQLYELGLPVVPYYEQEAGLAFDLVSSTSGERVMTGHMNGVITVDLSEVSDPHREALRVALNEEYRTMLGHFRHEIGHYYWQKLVDDLELHTSFRELFGDEQADYGAALNRHYRLGSPPNWRESYLSHYATTHPWEDFAETFAHYLHIRDTLQTAASFGLNVDGPPSLLPDDVRSQYVSAPPIEGRNLTFEQIMGLWRPVYLALNHLNRAMGQNDFYPFALPPTVLLKLEYVHQLVRMAARL